MFINNFVIAKKYSQDNIWKNLVNWLRPIRWKERFTDGAIKFITKKAKVGKNFIQINWSSILNAKLRRWLVTHVKLPHENQLKFSQLCLLTKKIVVTYERSLLLNFVIARMVSFMRLKSFIFMRRNSPSQISFNRYFSITFFTSKFC